MTERKTIMAEFPKEFVWGAATAAYQIEGGATEGGKGLSIWDVFSHTPGCTYRGETGDVACDSYHRWKEDLALLQSMHLKAYRFSVAWTRIAPNGGTDWNEEGFAYYDTLPMRMIMLTTAIQVRYCSTVIVWTANICGV
jgi:beta-glucosidase